MTNVFIVDNVPSDSNRPDRSQRPHAIWKHARNPEFDDAKKFWTAVSAEKLDFDGKLVAAHVNDPRCGEKIVVGRQAVSILADLGKRICAGGGRLLGFSGGPIEGPLNAAAELLGETRDVLTQAGFEEGTHFAFADWHDVDSEVIRDIDSGDEILDRRWKIRSLFRALPGSTRSFLALIELFAGQAAPRQIAAGLNPAELRDRLLNRRAPDRVDRARIEELLEWLATSPGEAMGEEAAVPLQAAEWLAAVRRALRSKPASLMDQEDFERRRDHLSHSLFGNNFAQKLGTGGRLDFLDGYWKYLADAGEPARAEDDFSEERNQWESVEGALKRWPGIRSALCAFAAAIASGGDDETWRIRLRTSGELVDDQVRRIPAMAHCSEGEKWTFKHSLSMDIATIREILSGLKLRQDIEQAAASGRGAARF